ncbi:MAG: PSD1 domain-containing protein [Phycisphaerales bacterium]|nr:PSD1 domain-containing protein [Phycisphaerales bacterium]
MAASQPLPDRLWLAAGKMHPLVVHFPIALLVVAAVFEFIRLRRGINKPSSAAFVCLWLGALGAIAAAALGWSSAETAGYSGSTAWILTTHRWLGVATAIIGTFAALTATISQSFGDLRLLRAYRTALVFAVLLVGVAGHFGGSLVHGETYIQDAIAQALGRDGGSATGSGEPVLASAAAKVDYHRDIEPILIKRCYQCHTGEKPEGGLSLAERAGAIKGGKSGLPGIVPGNVLQSHLYQLVSGADPKKRMPPKGGALADEQIAAIRAWIDQGASWDSPSGPGEHWHWAYRAPVRPNPPAVKNTNWARNPIDHFVLAKIEAEGLSPSPEADRYTLIRRLSLDLTGLPPSVEEVDAFINDRSAGAYERVVDRLLASPHYGERWGRLWLDLARYADSHGYEKDGLRVMWPYRDWVIGALNADMPYDQFTIEQLAGDFLDKPTGRQLVATGFHRNTQTNEEGGTDIEEFRLDAVIDRINTTGSVWLGSTVGCAQCHNHKNDPLTQKEYYQLLAIFNQDALDVRIINSSEKYAAGAMIDYPRDARFDQLDELNDRLDELERLTAARTPELEAQQSAWEQQVRARIAAWSTLTPAKAESAAAAGLAIQPDGSVLASGEPPESDTYTLEFPLPAGEISAIRLETIPDPSLPKGGAGRADNSNFVLSDFAASLVNQGAEDPSQAERRLTFGSAVADHEQQGGDVSLRISASIDADPRSGWAIGGKETEPHSAVLVLAEPLKLTAPANLRITMKQEYGGRHTIGRFRISATQAEPGEVSAAGILPPTLRAGIMMTARERTDSQSAAIWDHFRAIAPALAPARQELASLQSKRSELIVAQALVMQRNDAPRQTHLFVRGNFLTPGDPVEATTPSYLPSIPAGVPVNRLTFAQWITSPQNPLTARVQVNRLWEGIFGRGIVETSEDFGPQGDPPTHPELLDWLATELVRDQWSLKQALKTIVTSATYRQSSRVTPELLQKDPYNRLLARAPRFRVEAEMIRDIGLTSSGLLTRTIGGPSVYPPQPEGTWTQIYSGERWMESKGPDRYRRGLYTFWRRTSPYPAFMGFDAPSREISCTRRPRTNTPLQALTTLNDPAYVEMAAAMARRMMSEGGASTASRAAYGMRLCVGRRPSEAEVQRLVDLFDAQLESYRGDAGSASDMASFGVAGAGGQFDPAEVSAWTVVANVLLNLDETLTRQ